MQTIRLADLMAKGYSLSRVDELVRGGVARLIARGGRTTVVVTKGHIDLREAKKEDNRRAA